MEGKDEMQIEEKHKKAMAGDYDAIRTMIMSYYEMSNEALRRKDAQGFKFQALARYWKGVYEGNTFNAGDTVEYDVGGASPRWEKASVSNCYMTDARLAEVKRIMGAQSLQD